MMPLLDVADLIRMFSLPAVDCPECGRPTHQNYCRECDEFYRVGHARTCAQYGEHGGHRIYPTPPVMPFVTTPSEWAIYLDTLRQKHVWIEHAAIVLMFGETIGSPGYCETFMDMGDRALAWAEKAQFPLREGKVYHMHFAGSTVELRIGVVGGQFVLFIPRPEIEG
jgi:hypothetical protein